MKSEVKFRPTDEQIAALQPLYQRALDADFDDRPGMIIAQCRSDGQLWAAFVPHEKARAVRTVIGTNTPIVKV